VRVVAGQAIRFVERLALVRLLQVGTLGIVAIKTERGRRFGQMEIELNLPDFAGLVGDVAGIAAHVQCGMAAAVLPGILRALVVAGEAEIIFFIPRGRLQQLKLVAGSMRFVASQALANRRLVHVPLDLGGVLVAMAIQADFVGDNRDEFHAGDVPVDPDFMAAQTAYGNCGVDRLAFRFVLVALEALGAVGLRIEPNGMNGGVGAGNQKRDHRNQNPTNSSDQPVSLACDWLLKPDATREKSHTASKGWMCTKITVSQKNCCELHHRCKLLN